MTEAQLIKEAIKRGYHENTIIQYIESFTDYDQLGSGEFKEINGDLIKYEFPKEQRHIEDNQCFDTIYDAKLNKWAKIID